jgi:hypothetical protein
MEQEIVMARYSNQATPSDHGNELRSELDRDEITLGPDRPPPTTTLTKRRLRRLLEAGLLVASTGVILLAAHATGGDGSPATPRTAPTPSPSARAEVGPLPQALPRLVAFQTAAPGERVIVLAYRNRRLCGPAELRFDGRPTPQKLRRYAGPPNPDHVEMFIAMDVPRSAEPGSHVIELYGPRQGGPGGPLCGDVPEHQARLATTTILVEPNRNQATTGSTQSRRR